MKKMLLSIGIGAVVLISALLAFLWYVGYKADACRKGEGQEGIAACTRVMRFSRNPTLPLFKRSGLYIKEGRLKEALADLSEIGRLVESGRSQMPAGVIANSYSMIASHSLKSGDYTEALRLTDLAIQAGAPSSAVYFQRAAAFSGVGKYADALSCMQESERLGDTSEGRHLMFGVLHAALGEHQKAYERFKTAERFTAGRENIAKLDQKLGLTCIALGRYREGLEYLKRAKASGASCEDCPAAIVAAQNALQPRKKSR